MTAGIDRQLYLDEVEKWLRCAKRHCRSPVRIALLHDNTEGFVGGLACVTDGVTPRKNDGDIRR